MSSTDGQEEQRASLKIVRKLTGTNHAVANKLKGYKQGKRPLNWAGEMEKKTTRPTATEEDANQEPKKKKKKLAFGQVQPGTKPADPKKEYGFTVPEERARGGETKKKHGPQRRRAGTKTLLTKGSDLKKMNGGCSGKETKRTTKRSSQEERENAAKKSDEPGKKRRLYGRPRFLNRLTISVMVLFCGPSPTSNHQPAWGKETSAGGT